MPDLNTTAPEQFHEALKRRNLEGKRALIADLESKKSDRAYEILVDLLEDESWYLRELAVNALTDAGEKVVPRLYAYMESGLWYTRSAAARALGRMQWVDSLPRLIELLHEANATVRESALASIADLVNAGYAREAAVLLWQLGRRPAEEWKRAFLSLHPTAGKALAEYLDRPSSFLEAVPVSEEDAASEEPGSEETHARA